jgi:hypothetical protein
MCAFIITWTYSWLHQLSNLLQCNISSPISRYRQNRNWSMVGQSHINPGRQIAVAAKFCTAATNIFGPSVWNFMSPF